MQVLDIYFCVNETSIKILPLFYGAFRRPFWWVNAVEIALLAREKDLLRTTGYAGKI